MRLIVRFTKAWFFLLLCSMWFCQSCIDTATEESTPPVATDVKGGAKLELPKTFIEKLIFETDKFSKLQSSRELAEDPFGCVIFAIFSKYEGGDYLSLVQNDYYFTEGLYADTIVNDALVAVYFKDSFPDQIKEKLSIGINQDFLDQFYDYGEIEPHDLDQYSIEFQLVSDTMWVEVHFEKALYYGWWLDKFQPYRKKGE